MGFNEQDALREIVVHLDRYRGVIEPEVNRRMGRGEPTPAARAEIVRRFRTFCRLASFDMHAARPSLDGLGGQDPPGLERAVSIAVEVAIECCPPDHVKQPLRDLELRFRAGIRHLMTPKEERRPRKGRRKTPNAGKRVRAAIDRIADSFVAVCLDTGTIYDVNPAAETLLGIDAEKLLKRPFIDLLPASARADFQSLEARLDAGEDSSVESMVFNRGDGGTVRAEVSVANHTIGSKRLAIFIARALRSETDSLERYSTRAMDSAGIFSTRHSTARSR